MLESKCYWHDKPCNGGYFCNECELQPPDEEKRNYNAKPLEVKEWDYGMPICPACGEMPYSYERCVFCGQKIIIPKKNEPKPPKVTGGKIDDEGIVVCDCGSRHLTFVAHFDGNGFWGETYNCENGHVVSVRH